ncbi:hypothetical protein H696_04569 [Fonticula alba]|uniref:Plasminogen receptor (KT) n=1 Tax=Fonticula alba TaxID=691883 RepID=A0A058Z4F6_FONAL|nr:hypothetical protein H696_04569 [Fonticula alba]KCV69155.1 hypothetical protein H696_04569 [Fonticula alba]|eukprot:XP_009496726.1 hypothetical protein H696_04569 [Fonticula alba]
MGSYISRLSDSAAQSMADRQRAVMAEQRAHMERQIRRQIASRIAQTREMMHWQGGFWLLLASGVTIARIRLGYVPKPLLAPLFVMPFMMAYQYDMAYGTKLDRIRDEADRILAGDDFWISDHAPERVYHSLLPWAKPLVLLPPGESHQQMGQLQPVAEQPHQPQQQ